MIANKAYQAPFSNIPEPIYYTVRWVSEGIVLQENQFTSPAYANLEYLGVTPSKPSDENYKYEFLGWEKTEKDHSITFTANWKLYQRYTIIWKNGASTLQTSYYYEGETVPVYNGGTPTKTADTTAKYVFKEWSSSISGNTTTYAAVFSEYPRITVKWVVEGTTKQTSYYYTGETEPSYTGSTPTKAASSIYTYTFSSWSKTVNGLVTTYTAQFTSTRYYTWERYNVVEDGKRYFWETGRYCSTSPELYADKSEKNSSTNMSIRYNGAWPLDLSKGISFYTQGISSAAALYASTTRPSIDTLTGAVTYPTGTKVMNISTDGKSNYLTNYESYRGYYFFALCGTQRLPATLSPNVYATGAIPTIGFKNRTATEYDYDEWKDNLYMDNAWFIRFETDPANYFTIRHYMKVYNIVYKKGDTKYTNVTSTSATAHPDNGKEDEYWYVKIS